MRAGWRRLAALAALGSALAAGACASVWEAGDPTPAAAVSARPGPDDPAGAIRATPMPSAPLDAARSPRRIVFASCAHQREDQSLWGVIAGLEPDLVILLGDNVYGDVRSGDPGLPELKAAYMRLADSAPFAAVRAVAPVLATWDDHDYGLNDGGADFALKAQSEALFDHVWATPPDDPRRSRDGVYGSWMLGPEGNGVQVVLLDTRFFRSPLTPTDEPGAPGRERYVPDSDPEKTMLGEDQWAWLAAELRRPARVRLLGTSIQAIADGHGWEAWRLLSAERERLFRLLEETGAAANTLILSGDRHAGAYYRLDRPGGPLFEATASSINLPAAKWRRESGETSVEAGPHRLGGMIYEPNFGLIEIDEGGALSVSLRDAAGEIHAVDGFSPPLRIDFTGE